MTPRTPTLERPDAAARDREWVTPRPWKTIVVVLGIAFAVLLAMLAAVALLGEDEPAGEPVAEEPAGPAEPAAPQAPVAEEPAAEPVLPEVRFAEEPRANWDVTGVAPDDVLNIRSDPGVHNPVIGTFAHDAAEFESTGRIAYVGTALWREVMVPGATTGWVNARYLTETAPPPPQVRYGEELRANYEVVGVAPDDVLNIRSGPGVHNPVIGTFAHDAAEFESTGRIAYVGTALWREVIVPGAQTGWVNARYLRQM